jgi:hypothetical protein
MNWQIEWGGDPVFGYEFAEILADGIEAGIDVLEYILTCGHWCDGCGEWAITHQVDYNEETPTHRGTEFRLLPYQLCDKCDPKGGGL